MAIALKMNETRKYCQARSQEHLRICSGHLFLKVQELVLHIYHDGSICHAWTLTTVVVIVIIIVVAIVESEIIVIIARAFNGNRNKSNSDRGSNSSRGIVIIVVAAAMGYCYPNSGDNHGGINSSQSNSCRVTATLWEHYSKHFTFINSIHNQPMK